ATIVIVSIYILVNVSNIAFYWREQRGEFNLFFNLLVPVVGTLVFLPALLAAFGIDFGGLGISPLAAPANAAPGIIGVWMLIGIVLLVYLRQRARDRITKIGTVFL